MTQWYIQAMFRPLLICLMLLACSVHATGDLEALKKAAEQGDVEAQISLGIMYTKGKGVPVDIAQTVYWFRKAAEQGDAKAQFSLGVMYALGEGVPEDDARPYTGFERLLNRDTCQLKAVSASYMPLVKGLPRIIYKPYAWFSIAAAQGDEKAKNAKETIAKNMIRAEIAEAQKLSRKYWEAYVTVQK